MHQVSTSEAEPPSPSGSGLGSIQTLVVDKVRLRWSDRAATGDPEGVVRRPLLLVNGLGGNLEMWGPLVDALPDRRVIAYDAPGTGGSGTARRAADMASLARMASRVLDAAGVDDVDVLGYSFGGFVAQELARVDDRVSRLVLAATGAGWSTSLTDLRELGTRSSLRMPLAFGIMLTPSRYYLKPQGQRVIRKVFGDDAGGDYSSSDAARAASPPSSLGYLWQLLAASRWSSRSWLGDLRMPALVLSGEHDAIATVAAGRYLAGHLGDGRQIVVPGVGHAFLLEEDPSEVARLVTDFLDGEGRAAAA